MAQSALKYDEFDQMDQVPIPAGGIATFLTAETGSWADDDEVMPKKGIAQVHQIADKLAEYGRNEDEYMVHAAEGETVIPMEVFDKNPTLRNKLFAEMRLMGIEPERYVVGNELNSINPVTGQPEFFLKKLFKGLKKIVKAVLPVVATIALTAVGVPYPIASAIVSGAQTAIAGGDFKDVLKSAAISGVSAGIANKVSNTYDWAGTTARRAMIQSGINTALSGGSTGDVLKGAAIAGAVSKGAEFATGTGGKIEEADKVDFLGRKINPDAAPVTAEVIDSVADNAAIKTPDLQADFGTGEGAVSGYGGFAGQPSTGPVDGTGSISGYGGFAGEPTAAPIDVNQTGITVDPVDVVPTGSMRFDPLTQTQVFDPTGTASMDIGTSVVPTGTMKFDPLTQTQVLDTGAQLDTSAQVDPNAPLPTGVDPGPATVTGDPATLVSAPELPGAMDSFKDIFTGSGVEGEGFSSRIGAVKDLFLPGIDRGQADTYLKNLKTNNPKAYAASFGNKTISDAYRQMSKDAFQGIGGFARKYGPAIGAGLGVMALAPKPEQPELIDLDTMTTGQTLIDADPSKYRIYPDGYVYQQPNFTVQNVAGQYGGIYGDNPIFQPTPVATAADGGIMNVSDFPRRNGGIAGPGTETSDDIPAMLSDGEFVFTAQAVRGAGKGSREDGMKNMYQMMRQFEARA